MLLDMLLYVVGHAVICMYVYLCVKSYQIKWIQIKNRGYIASLSSASGRQRALPTASRRQRGHVAATCRNLEHWAAYLGTLLSAIRRHSWPRGSFPVLAELSSLLSVSRRQRALPLRRPLVDGKARR